MSEEYSFDLIKTLILTGFGLLAFKAMNWYIKAKTSPILLGGVTPDTATKELTVDLPIFWVPYQEGDSETSVQYKFTPDVSIEDSNWILQFKPIYANIKGITTSYTPDTIKIPITSTMTTTELVIKLKPSVTTTVDPIGWNVKFPKFTVLA